MKCFFLSLDSDPRAWKQARESFLNHAPGHWDLERFDLLSGSGVERSWHRLLQMQQSARQPFMVVIPGVRFGEHSFLTLENSMEHLEKTGGFDLLFADLRLMQAGAMADLFVLRRQLVAQGRTRLIDLRPLGFEAPSACIIHPRAFSQVATVTGAATTGELVEQALCRPAREGVLTARFVFPFATTMSGDQDGQVPADPAMRASIIGDIFRRMVWRDGGCEPELAPGQTPRGDPVVMLVDDLVRS